VSIVLVLVGVAVIGAVAVVLAGRSGGQTEFAPDRAPFDLPDAADLETDQVEQVRFSVGFRGYRMDQVDQVLDRLTGALAERDRRIAELEGPGQPGTTEPVGTEPAGTEPAGGTDATAADEPGETLVVTPDADAAAGTDEQPSV